MLTEELKFSVDASYCTSLILFSKHKYLAVTNISNNIVKFEFTNSILFIELDLPFLYRICKLQSSVKTIRPYDEVRFAKGIR